MLIDRIHDRPVLALGRGGREAPASTLYYAPNHAILILPMGVSNSSHVIWELQRRPDLLV